MERDERRVGMFGEDPVARFEQRFEGRIVAAVEAPVGMLNEFLVALIGGVDRMKEGLGVAGVNEDGNSQAAAFFPHGVKTWIVYGD